MTRANDNSMSLDSYDPSYSPREVSEYLVTPLSTIEQIIEDLGIEPILNFSALIKVANAIPDKTYYVIDDDNKEPQYMIVWPHNDKDGAIVLNPHANIGMPSILPDFTHARVLFRRILEGMLDNDDGFADMDTIAKDYDVSTQVLNDVLYYEIAMQQIREINKGGTQDE